MSRLSMIERGFSLPLRFVLLFCIFTSCFLVTPLAAQASTPNFQIRVPHKPSPKMEIFMLKITVSVTTTVGPINITLVRNDGSTETGTVSNLSPGAAPSSNTPIGPPANQDVMKVFSPPAGLRDTDPAKKKYVIVLSLFSNVVFSTCERPGGVLSGPDETWTVSVTGAQFDGACVQSLDRNDGLGVCQTTNRTIPLNDTPSPSDAVATIVGAAAPQLGCRPGVDAVLVLDRSGSMTGRVAGGPNPNQIKFDALKSAVSIFMTAWTNLRRNEINTMQSGNPNIVSPPDRVGVAFFDSSNPARWLNALSGSSTVSGMNSMSDTIATDISSRTATVSTGGATSIGSGLLLAANALAPCTDLPVRKVVVVMSDGMENTAPRTRVSADSPTQVQTVNSAGTASNLTCQPPTQIYALTIGSTGTIDPTINQAISTASGGFYLNSEYDADVLSSFFTQVLQNFIKFSTVETYLMVSKQASFSVPFTRELPVTTTTTSLTFALSWDPSKGQLKLTLTPPGGAPPIVRTVIAGDRPGTMVLNVPLTVSGSPRPGGNWGILIEQDVLISSLSPLQQVPPVPFNLTVLGDDTALNSDLTTVAADYAPGDQIRLSAKITELGDPVIGANVLADLVRPDAGGIGDLLSTSTANTSQPPSPDQLSDADAKLQNTLKADSNAIKRAQGPVPLFDDGSAANGDAVAGDGVYSALFPAQLIGHYNFTIGAVGATKNVGTFSRQQLRTVHVRAVPDGDKTTVSSNIQTGTPNFLVVDLTPLTKFGNHLGPGWGNYFWITGNGMSPMKFSDNMNGTYTAKIPFTNNPPSDVKVHFERVNEHIPDDARPDNLPVPLGPGTVVVTNVPVPPGGTFKRWGLSLHAGVSIPHGNLNNVFNPGPNFAIDLEYRFNQTFSLEGIYGYHRFNGETFGIFTVPDLNVHQFSVNGKVYGSSSPVRPFFNFGGGAYVFTPGVSTHGGLNFGGGLQFDVTPNFAVEGNYNYHTVFTSGSNTNFSAVQGGVRFRF